MKTIFLTALAAMLTPFAAGATAVTPLCSSIKVLPRGGPPVAIANCGSALKAAQNEFEMLQLAVSADTAALSGVSVSAPVLALRGSPSVTLPADAIVLFREELVQLTAASNNEGAVGATATSPIPYPDPLIPAQETTATAQQCTAGTSGCSPNGVMEAVTTQTRNAFPFDVPLGENRVVLLDLHVPDGQAQGIYDGTVHVTGTASGVPFDQAIAITLTVRPFRLSSTSALPSFFNFTVDAVCAAHGIGTCQTVDAFHFWSRMYGRLLLDHRMTLQMIDDHTTVGSFDYTAKTGAFTDAYEPLIDGAETTGRRLRNAKATTLLFPWFNQNDASDAVKSEKALKWAQYTLGKSWMPIMLDYTGDEPANGHNTTWAETSARAIRLKAGYPRFRTSANASIADYVANLQTNPQPNFIDVLIPLWDQLDDPNHGNLVSNYDAFRTTANHRVWEYQSCSTANGCGDPAHVNWISFLIDTTAVQNRAQPWMSFIYDQDNRPTGMMYFDVAQKIGTAWTPGGLLNASGNGDGTLVYAGTPQVIGGTTHEPLASLRLKLLREGLEDYEYLRMCAQKDPARARSDALAVFPMNGFNGTSGSVYSAGAFPAANAAATYATNLENARDDLAACIGAPGSVRRVTASRLNAGDFDGDGKTDLAVFRPDDIANPRQAAWYITPSNGAQPYRVPWGVAGDIEVSGDYDGDGKTDVAIFRPVESNWYIVDSSTGQAQPAIHFGNVGDVPVPGDYDGDGKTDLAVWTPGTGVWTIRLSSNPQQSPLTVQWGYPGDFPVPGDYDGDGKTDFAIWRPSSGDFWVKDMKDVSTGAFTVQRLGGPGDVPVPGDYDGDGKTDYAVWRSLDGNWLVLNSTTGTQTITQWGLNGDIPVPGDYDGDGKTDMAVFRPNGATWWILGSTSGFNGSRQWGAAGDVPAVNTRADAPLHALTLNAAAADFSGHRQSDAVVWHPSDGVWHVVPTTTFAPSAPQWGQPGDVPVSFSYHGTGVTNFAIWRPADGTWWIDGDPQPVQWGLPGDVPVPGDYDGDGIGDLAVWRPSNGGWYIISSSTQGQLLMPDGTLPQFGASSDIPVPGDYDGDGRTDLAVFRPSTQTWYVKNTLTGAWWPQPFGQAGDIPVPGDYDGDGKTDFAVFRPSDGTWHVMPSASLNQNVTSATLGVSGDIPAPGDYDGDGWTDFAVYHPADGTLNVRISSDGSIWTLQTGATGALVPLTVAPGTYTPPPTQGTGGSQPTTCGPGEVDCCGTCSTTCSIHPPTTVCE